LRGLGFRAQKFPQEPNRRPLDCSFDGKKKALELMPLNGKQTKTEIAVEAATSSDRSLHVVRRLRKAFLSICRCGDVVFSPYRLTTEQYSLMRAVQRDPGIRQVDVKDRIFAEPNTVTAMVTLLERRGILRRKPSPLDGRARLLYLTSHGQAVMAHLSEDWQPMRELLRKCFSGKGGQEALEILDMVFAEMERERENLLKKVFAEHPVEADLQEVVRVKVPAAENGSRAKLTRAAAPRTQSRKKAARRPKTMDDVLHS
jgi:DNA-binding MarR family transcriptional regulator